MFQTVLTISCLSVHAEDVLEKRKQYFEDALRELEQVSPGSETPKFMSSVPVGSIREVQDGGSDVLIGSINLRRSNFGEHLNTDTIDWDNKQKNEMENESKAIGDPTIYWMIGCGYMGCSDNGNRC